MKKKTLTSALILALSLTLAGCASNNDTAAGTDNATVESAPADEISNTLDSADSSSEDTTSTDSENSDSFWLTATLHKSAKEQSLKTDDSGFTHAIVYDAKIDGDTLTVKGDMYFKNNLAQDNIATYDKKEISLKLTDNTKYILAGGVEDEELSKEDFAKQLTDLIDSELDLEIQVQGDEVLEIRICS